MRRRSASLCDVPVTIGTMLPPHPPGFAGARPRSGSFAMQRLDTAHTTTTSRSPSSDDGSGSGSLQFALSSSSVSSEASEVSDDEASRRRPRWRYGYPSSWATHRENTPSPHRYSLNDMQAMLLFIPFAGTTTAEIKKNRMSRSCGDVFRRMRLHENEADIMQLAPRSRSMAALH